MPSSVLDAEDKVVNKAGRSPVLVGSSAGPGSPWPLHCSRMAKLGVGSGFPSCEGPSVWEGRVKGSLALDKAGVVTSALFVRTPWPRGHRWAREQRKLSTQGRLLTLFLAAVT